MPPNNVEDNLELTQQFNIREEQEDGPAPTFVPNSCIIVVGTVGRGKTTLMNLYTGQNGETASITSGVTKKILFYEDKRHPCYPDWVDTTGWNEA